MTVENNNKDVTSENEDKKDEIENKSSEADASAGEKGSGSESPFNSIDDAVAEINRLKAINKDVIDSRDEAKEKLRKIESEAESIRQKELEEQGQYKELLEEERKKREALEASIRDKDVSSSLSKALEKEGALSIETALKLVDRDKIKFSEDGQVSPESVVEAIAEVKENHSVLFGGTKPQTPKVKRAGEQAPTGGYVEELQALQKNPNATHADLVALRAKYGK